LLERKSTRFALAPHTDRCYFDELVSPERLAAVRVSELKIAVLATG